MHLVSAFTVFYSMFLEIVKALSCLIGVDSLRFTMWCFYDLAAISDLYLSFEKFVDLFVSVFALY